MQRLSIEGSSLRALAVGPESGPLVIALHGFPDVPQTWEPLGRRLALDGFRVVAPYLRGYAPSTLEGPFDFDRLVRDLFEVADALAPGRPFDVVGHDWGAAILYVACGLREHRIRRAVALSVPHFFALRRNVLRHPAQLRRSWYMFFLQLRGIAETLGARDDFAFVDKHWRDWSPGYTPAPAHCAALEQCLRASWPAPILYYRAAFAQQLAEARGRPLAGLTGRIAVPTLYLHGEDDGCVGAELAEGQEKLFGGRFERAVIPRCGHFLQLERPDVVYEYVRRFLLDDARGAVVAG
jgi:pimeloyl-ACP methyl ester carboxylesterase